MWSMTALNSARVCDILNVYFLIIKLIYITLEIKHLLFFKDDLNMKEKLLEAREKQLRELEQEMMKKLNKKETYQF